MTKHLTSGKALVLFDQALVSGGNFLLGVLLARFLGVKVFGEYALLWMGVMFLLSLHQAFMTKPLMSLFAGKKEWEKANYIQSLFVLQLIISLGIVVLGLLFFFIFKKMEILNGWVYYLPLTGLLAALYLLQDFFRKIFFVKKQYGWPLLLDFVGYAPMLLALPMLHFLDDLNLLKSLVVMTVSYFISCAVGGGIFFKLFISNFIITDFTKSRVSTQSQSANTTECLPPIGPPFSDNNTDALNFKIKKHFIKTFKEHYHYSFWLLGTSLVQWFAGNFFLIAAASVLGTVAVGALRMAQNMVGLCHVLFLAMENIIPAEAAQQFFDRGKIAMFSYLRRVTLWGSFPVLLMLGGLTIASPWLIESLYGANYLPYAYLVGAYSLLYVFAYFGFPLRYALRTLHFTSPIFIAYCLSAGVSLLIAFPLANNWGLSGIMIGLIGSQLLTLSVYIYFLNHKKLNYHKQYENHPRSTW